MELTYHRPPFPPSLHNPRLKILPHPPLSPFPHPNSRHPTPPDARILFSHLSISPHSNLSPLRSLTQSCDIFGSAHVLLGISDYPKSLSLYNPTNNTFHITKPPLLHPHVEAHWVDFTLGYDSLSDDYKIVMINQLNTRLPVPGHGSMPLPEVTFYSLKNPIWRKLNLTFPHYLAFPRTYTHAKYLASKNSLLYVCAVNPPKVYDSSTPVTSYAPLENNYRLVDFNLSTETFSVSLFPEFDHNGRYYPNKKEGHEVPLPFITVSGSDLICQVGCGPAEGRALDMWVKKEKKGGEWVKLFRFGFEVDGPKVGVKGYARPVVVSSDGEEVLMEGDLCSYFWYKVKSGEVREVVIEDGMTANYHQFGGFPHQTRGVVYHESLVVLGNCGLELAEDEEDEDDSKGVVIMKPGVG